jgi:hypothetical protein
MQPWLKKSRPGNSIEVLSGVPYGLTKMEKGLKLKKDLGCPIY